MDLPRRPRAPRFGRYGPVVALLVVALIVGIAILAMVGGKRTPESACDGPNMLYRNNDRDIVQVVANDPRCTGREGTN